MKSIFLDSTPLGLLMTRPGHRQGDECRSWLMRHLANGIRVIVPEIIDYELRRELLRLGNMLRLMHRIELLRPQILRTFRSLCLHSSGI